MPRFLVSLATLLLAVPAAQAQTAASASIDCTHPFGLLDKMERVYQLQDASGKAVGTIRQRVVSLGEEQNKKKTVTTATALVKSGTYDAKNHLQHQQDLTFRCRQDTSFTDGMAELSPESLRSFRDRRFSYTPVPLAWPNQPAVGTEIPSGGISVQVSSTAVDIARVYTTVQKRRITGMETISTPAGTFQCYRVEAERESATVARADMVLRTTVKVVDYYAPGTGIVKTEIYDKKGKLEQVRLLTAIHQASESATRPKIKEKYKVKKS